MEAYGLIGLFTVLQLTLSIFDSAITPVLNREMSRFTGNQRDLDSTRNLLRTMEIVSLSIGLIFIALICSMSGFLAENWLKAENTPTNTLSEAIRIGGLVVTFRFIEGIYKGAIIGLQKQVELNWIQIIWNSFRNIGVIFALAYISPTIQCFFYWQGLSSILMTLSLTCFVYKYIPEMTKKAKFSIKELKSIWKFASGSTINTLLNFACMQSDKIILSKFLTLTEFGHYSLAVSITNTITYLMTPLSQAYYPQLVRLRSLGQDKEAEVNFHQCCQLINIVCGVASLSLVFYCKPIIGYWTHNPELTNAICPIITILAIGSYLMNLSHFPSMLTYTVGKPMENSKCYITCIFSILCFSLPLIINYGVVGAALGNVLQNIILVAFFPVYFNCYLKNSQIKWLTHDLIFPTLFIVILFWISNKIFYNLSMDLPSVITTIIIALVILLLGVFFCKDIRNFILQKLNIINNQ